jgi:catechol 2,3-dioxygenase-like lactoylglutathione lyase family enzyme
MNIRSFAAVFPVSDLETSLRYFVEVLGFREEFRFGQYAGLVQGECRLHLSQQGNPNAGPPGTGAVYIFCDEVDAYYADIVSRGAKVDGEPRNYEYAMRDFIARDPDGNQVSFGVPTRAE